MAIVITDNIHYQNIANKIREKTGEPVEAKYRPADMQYGIEAVYEEALSKGYDEGETAGYLNGYDEGVEAEYDRFWDAFQQNGNRKDYAEAFSRVGWTAANFKPKYDIKPTTCGSMFINIALNIDLVQVLSNLGVTLDFSNSTTMTYVFQNSQFTHIGVVDLRKNSGTCTNTFNSAAWCVQVDKVIVSESTTYSATFNWMNALQEIRFEGTIGQNGITFQQSPKLSKASITSVINALSSTASGKTVTFSSTAVTSAFGSTTATEWTSLVATKSNWTISLV